MNSIKRALTHEVALEVSMHSEMIEFWKKNNEEMVELEKLRHEAAMTAIKNFVEKYHPEYEISESGVMNVY